MNLLLINGKETPCPHTGTHTRAQVRSRAYYQINYKRQLPQKDRRADAGVASSPGSPLLRMPCGCCFSCSMQLPGPLSGVLNLLTELLLSHAPISHLPLPSILILPPVSQRCSLHHDPHTPLATYTLDRKRGTRLSAKTLTARCCLPSVYKNPRRGAPGSKHEGKEGTASGPAGPTAGESDLEFLQRTSYSECLVLIH